MNPYLRLNFNPDESRRWTANEIVSSISNQIDSQKALDGCRLPPVRALAHQLGISKTTVLTAYDELKARGVIESKERLGLFVREKTSSNKVNSTNQVPAPKIREFPPLISFKKPIGPLDKNINLSAMFIDPRLLPKKQIADCFRSALKHSGLQNFPDLQGYAPLREQIAERLRNRGISCAAKNIVITGGSQQALDIIIRALESQTIATENPAFLVGKALIEMNRGDVIGLPVHPFEGIDFDEWENQIKKHSPGLLYLTSSYQNPSAYSYSTEEINQILNWSQKYQFGILEDDWGSDMLSFNEFRPSLRSLGGENVLYMNSFTKKLLPSLRVGYLLAGEKSIQSLIHCKRVSSPAVPTLVEVALSEFLSRGYYDTHLKKIQSTLDKRYANCLNLLRELMPEDVRWSTPGGGPSLWLEIPKNVSIGHLIESLEKKNCIIQPADQNFIGNPHLHGFRIGYAYLNEDEMERGLGLLAKELRKMTQQTP